jgi:hypothetical protein
MSMSEDRELRRNERIDRFIILGRTVLSDNWDDLPVEVRAVTKAALSSIATYLTKERANGNLLSRSSSPNGFLTLTSEEKRLLSDFSKS